MTDQDAKNVTLLWEHTRSLISTCWKCVEGSQTWQVYGRLYDGTLCLRQLYRPYIDSITMSEKALRMQMRITGILPLDGGT